MGSYSIKELENLSGIKAHTIRVWEKRHSLIIPSRTATNIRSYSDEDLRKIINVSLLNATGIRISEIAIMSNSEINEKVIAIRHSKNDDTSIYIDQLVLAMLGLEEDNFEKLLNSLTIRLGFERTIIEIVYPFLEKIGILWLTENITPAHEHFISNLIRQKIIAAIDGLPFAVERTEKMVLFLPEGEMHELSLLFFQYIAKKRGYITYYLGQNVPHKDLINICATYKPNLLVTILTVPTLEQPLMTYLEKLSADFTSLSILVSGVQTAGCDTSHLVNLRCLPSPAGFRDLI